MKPKGLLVERRGKWLFHTTSFKALAPIVRSGELLSSAMLNTGDGDYISFSREPQLWDITGTDVVLVFDLASIRRKVRPVKYTQEWYRRWPEHAAYIAGEGWLEQFSLDDYVTGDDIAELSPEDREWYDETGALPDELEQKYMDMAELQSFIAKRTEREWVTRHAGSMKFEPGHLDRVLVIDRSKVEAVRTMLRGVLAPENVMAKGRRRR